MIFESSFWKSELKAQIIQLETLAEIEQPDEYTLFLFEKIIFNCAFIIRKLVESKKLKTSYENYSIETLFMPILNLKKLPNHFNAFRIEKFYDIESKSQRTINVKKLYDMLIHSYVFEFTTGLNEDKVAENDSIGGFFCNSDHERAKGLYLFSMEQIIKCFKKAANSNPTEISAIYNEEKSDYDFKSD